MAAIGSLRERNDDCKLRGPSSSSVTREFEFRQLCISGLRRRQIGIFIEGTLASLAERQFRGPFSKDPEALLIESQRRYLASLKQNISVMSRVRSCVAAGSTSPDALVQQLSDSPDDAHMRGILLDLLDLYPRWVQTALEGAVQHSIRKGPLASAGFSWSDLCRYLKVYRY